jgi:hypothetical protein
MYYMLSRLSEIKLPNPLFWIYKKYHKCSFENKLHDIPMENNTNMFITGCRCGKTQMIRAHRESKMYIEWNDTTTIEQRELLRKYK